MADNAQIGYPAYQGGAYREDVLDEIFQITPEDTPFYNMTGDTTATSVMHQWTERTLSTRGHNALNEGQEYGLGSFPNANVPSRLTNFCQILDKLPRVSLTMQAMNTVGIGDLMADQIALRSIEWKTDVEHALLRGSLDTGPTVGDTNPRQMSGFYWAITDGTFLSTGATFTEDAFNEMFERGWVRGASIRDVLVNGPLKRRISEFTGSTTKYIFAEDKQIVNSVNVYESDFYLTQIHKSRDVISAAGGYWAFSFDRDFFAKAWLRRPERRRLADTADDVRAVVVGELTLEFGHPGAADKLGMYYHGT